jgi:hypothetical protein
VAGGEGAGRPVPATFSRLLGLGWRSIWNAAMHTGRPARRSARQSIPPGSATVPFLLSASPATFSQTEAASARHAAAAPQGGPRGHDGSKVHDGLKEVVVTPLSSHCRAATRGSRAFAARLHPFLWPPFRQCRPAARGGHDADSEWDHGAPVSLSPEALLVKLPVRAGADRDQPSGTIWSWESRFGWGWSPSIWSGGGLDSAGQGSFTLTSMQVLTRSSDLALVLGVLWRTNTGRPGWVG